MNETLDFDSIMHIFSEIHFNCDHAISVHVGRARLLSMRADVRVVESDDDPPILKLTGRLEDILPDYDNLLGTYEARTRKITLFKKGIAWLADREDWNPMQLHKIVELHERPHAAHHLGPACSRIYLPADVKAALRARSANFRGAPEDFKEQLAQMVTLLVIRGQQNSVRTTGASKYFASLERVFLSLMKMQSPRYWLSDEVVRMDHERLRRKLGLLFELSDQRVYPTVPQIGAILA